MNPEHVKICIQDMIELSLGYIIQDINKIFLQASAVESHHYAKLAACNSKGHVEAFQLPF